MMSPKMPTELPVVDAAQSQAISRYIPVIPKRKELTEHIEVGSLYEIDHSKLPPRTPQFLLKHIRVVAVTAKSEQNVTVRYPGAESLERYFGNKETVDSWYTLPPVMDQKFVMGSELAALVLSRRVPSSEVPRNQNSHAFWLVKSLKTGNTPLSISNCNSEEDIKSKMGTCFSELLCGGLKWGSTRAVEYVKKCEEDDDYEDDDDDNDNGHHSVNHSSHVEVVKEELQEDEVSMDIITEEERQGSTVLLNNGKVKYDKTEEELERGKYDKTNARFTKSRKRKMRKVNSEAFETLKRGCEKKADKPKAANHKLELDKCRWSFDRYEKAKCELLNVMKARNAFFGSSIPRHELREEARKRIGDTGLLDHLLKHVVGMVAPGGAYRFKRKCDPDGKMQYWLEGADLVDIRKAAGVKDPYWTPPPGWKPGDPTCTHDSICAEEIRALKEELARAKRKMQSRVAQEADDDLGVGYLDCCIQDPMALKEKYEELLKRKAQRVKELIKISESLQKMEALMKSHDGV